MALRYLRLSSVPGGGSLAVSCAIRQCLLLAHGPGITGRYPALVRG